MTVPIYMVDAFAERPFSGNPAGVCPLEVEPEAAWMQSLAMELAQSETAFVWPRGEGFALRWFTPTTEVDLCGHATLATAHVLWTSGRLDPGRAARFETRSGELLCRRLADGRIELDVPEQAPWACDPPPDLERALGTAPRWSGRNRMDWFVELSDEAAVRALAPRPDAISSLGLRGLIATALAPEGRGYDFVSRFFAPQSGVPEDPVTGSAHCALGPFWCQRLGRAKLTGFQASRRGGQVEVEPRGARVLLRGRAVTVLEGALS